MSVTSGEQLPTAAPVQPASIDEQRGGAAGDPNGGLTSDEARGRLEKFGPNAMPDTSMHPFRMALEKFWAPVPWMLEAAVLLELVLSKYIGVDPVWWSLRGLVNYATGWTFCMSASYVMGER
jgi:magnesium-transporting ATPase (P-type)